MSDNHLGDARDVEGDRPPRNDCGPALHGGQNTPAWSVHPVRTVSSSGLRLTDEFLQELKEYLKKRLHKLIHGRLYER